MTVNDLIIAALAYADRNDVEVQNSIDTFITLVEARMNRLLKTREQSTRAFTTTVLDQEYYCLPEDYRGMRDIHLSNPNPNETHKTSQFNFITPEKFTQIRGSTCDKLYYTILANQLRIYPTQESGLSIELVYYQKVPALPFPSFLDTNWMLDEHPDIYLAGMCGEISLFAKDYDAATSWFKRMKTGIDELESADVEERWTGQSLITRVG